MSTDSLWAQCLLWLKDSWLKIEAERTSPTPILQGLVACWICEKKAGGDTRLLATRQTASSLQRFLERNGAVELVKCDAALVLLGAGILRSLSIKSKPLETFIKKVSVACASGLGQGSQADLSDVYVTKYLLHCLGLGGEVRPTEKLTGLEQLSAADLWFADAELVRSICNEVAAATVFGTCPPRSDEKFYQNLSVVLATWLLDYSRLYNLEMVCIVLRCLTYLRKAGIDMDEEVSAACEFLAAQQQPNGRIGFFGPEVAQLERSHPGFDDVVDLYLPVMLTVVWTVFEVTNTSSSLFSEITA